MKGLLLTGSRDAIVTGEPDLVEDRHRARRRQSEGGHLTMPPLPHHRAYGSVPRRFGGLSAHQRLHGKQAMILEAFVAEARCIAVAELSRQGPFGLKMAALATLSETLRRRSSR
jgi:hypothetical protein